MIKEQLVNIFRYNKLIWSIFCIILILNIAFHLSIGRYQRTRIHELQDIYREKRMAKPSVKSSAHHKFIQAKKDVLLFKNQLSPRSKFSDIFVELFKALNKNGLPVSKMSYTPETIDFHNISKFTTSFSVNGKYQSIKSFLADIQESKTLFCIENLSLLNRSSDEESVEIKLQIAAYFR